MLKRWLSGLLALGILVMPALAQDDGRLAAPQLNQVQASDQSQTYAPLGWCVTISWDVDPAAEGYAIRVRGKRKTSPRQATAESDLHQPKWVNTADVPGSAGTPGYVGICGLDELQSVTFRLRAIADASSKTFGIATAPFKVKLPQYGDAPVLPHSQVPTILVYGF